MIKLQKPKFVYMGGKLRLWDDANLHIGSEAVLRGLNVFEGVRGYWQPDGSFSLVKLRSHYERLQRSARLLYLPFTQSYDEYKLGLQTLCQELLQPGRDMWFRTTLYAIEGHWGEGTVTDLIITGYQAEMGIPPVFDLGVSTWRRSEDVAQPARIKTGTNYQVGRLARIEGRARGCQDMVLLNRWGRASEATAACLLVVRDGAVLTPPASEGALESITADIIKVLANDKGISFEHRPIERTELMIADEIGLCGTMDELRIAKTLDGIPLSQESPVLRDLQSRYLKAVRGVEPHSFVDLTPIHRLKK